VSVRREKVIEDPWKDEEKFDAPSHQACPWTCVGGVLRTPVRDQPCLTSRTGEPITLFAYAGDATRHDLCTSSIVTRLKLHGECIRCSPSMHSIPFLAQGAKSRFFVRTLPCTTYSTFTDTHNGGAHVARGIQSGPK